MPMYDEVVMPVKKNKPVKTKNMYSGTAIANYFIREHGPDPASDLTLMKLVKLVYLSHGWHLGVYGVPLLDENAEAWQYGPVVPSVYHAAKHFGKRPITTLLPVEFGSSQRSVDDFPQIQGFLDLMWDEYGQYSGLQLSALTHREGTPWDITWNKLGGKHSRAVQIPDNLIAEYYMEKIQKLGERQNPPKKVG